MKRTVWRTRKDEKERLKRKMRLAVALLTLIGVLTASAIYSFADDVGNATTAHRYFQFN